MTTRPGEELPTDRLLPYLREQLPGLDEPLQVTQFLGGHANLTYELKFGDRELVLRRPPFGTIAPGAHDMRREYHVLSRLHPHFAPAPRALLLCTDHDILGADFVVMERRHGTVIRYRLPEEFAGLPTVEERLTVALIRVTADLHRVDAGRAKLTDLGQPEGFAERQLRGWTKRWQLAKTEENPAMETLSRALPRAIPTPQAVSIVHGDLKFDNCQFQPGEPDRVTSVFDWDMATLGDPLIDLAGTLSFWPDPALDPAEMPLPLLEGDWPTKDFLKQQYASFTGFDLERMPWYEAFACFKTAVIAQQLYHRYLQGSTRDARMEKFGLAAKAFARLGVAKLGQAG
ncbi:aminoglycoside phosphotransferase (APT) family kinase protein [Lewinella marina]|uniref:Phosphotransferase family protein n=1 Tax=Neolewinella marina TaxID=438751 RepID=A0A2G0CJK3_9BACT|nr:phosphotransferase family protein [Neolewinella marina]NJB84667.1 aminoglycoside phosphotransferase (APT) family kinase protein [Neolewinella marina]PHL00160.1 phosphotransferase family protein [Neolewinella marina]